MQNLKENKKSKEVEMAVEMIGKCIVDMVNHYNINIEVKTDRKNRQVEIEVEEL